MNKLIRFLAEHKWLNGFILLVYFLLVVLPHEQVGLLTVKIFGGLSRENYNLIILIFAGILFALLIIATFKKALQHPQKKLILFYSVSTILFVVACFKVLFVMNIESIHFMQYGIFAILCFPLIGNFTQTLIWSTLAGAFDEAYQYFYLAPERTDYFDWNDVIINLIGAALGLLVLKIYRIEIVRTAKNFLQSPVFYFLCLLSLSVVVLLSTGILSIYADAESSTPFTLVKILPESFWSFPPGPYVKYHIVLPLEGLIITTLLWFFYVGLDKSN